jgi:hypothetical protein
MCDIPIEIADEEKIVRAVISPYHVNASKTKLRTSVFRSRPGADEVSVIRQEFKGSDFCKAKGCEIAAKARAECIGLAVLRSRQIRHVGSEVHDSREEYCGHAHISHGIVQPPPNEPLPVKQLQELDRKLEALRDSALYYRDPSPQANSWTGPEL